MDKPDSHSMMWPMRARYTASGNPPLEQRPQASPGRRAVLLGAAALSGLVAMWPGRTRAAFDMEAALAPRVVGDPDAPIHVAEYFSLSCSHCANFHLGTYQRLKTEWIDTGRIRFEYRDFPLAGSAIYAHALARAVPVDAYEGMLDILFKKQRQWAGGDNPVSELARIAKLAGIGRDAFAEIIGNRPYLEGIVAIAQQGFNDWNINSTPSFVVNERDVIRGDADYSEFTEVFEKYSA